MAIAREIIQDYQGLTLSPYQTQNLMHLNDTLEQPFRLGLMTDPGKLKFSLSGLGMEAGQIYVVSVSNPGDWSLNYLARQCYGLGYCLSQQAILNEMSARVPVEFWKSTVSVNLDLLLSNYYHQIKQSVLDVLGEERLARDFAANIYQSRRVVVSLQQSAIYNDNRKIAEYLSDINDRFIRGIPLGFVHGNFVNLTK